MSYQLFHLKDTESSNALHLLESVDKCSNSVANWGMFSGAFGLGTNEIYWVVYSNDLACPLDLAGRFELLQQVTLNPTVRPEDYAARSEEGIYVFRWFEVEQDRVPRVVELSNEAWHTFEGGFDTQVQGLFTVSPAMDCYSMLLVTWYRDLSVWQASREPDEAAKRNFRQRQALLDSARPIATRLVARVS